MHLQVTVERAGSFCESLTEWARLPKPGRDFYGPPLLECLFQVIEILEDSDLHAERERLVIEVSLWDVAVMTGLDLYDPVRASYIQARRERLLRALADGTTNRFELLLYRWAALLRQRNTKNTELPGVFRDDIISVAAELFMLGLPRRAKRLRGKFHVPADPMIEFAIAHRSEIEEVEKTNKLRARLQQPPFVPYGVLCCAGSLGAVTASSLLEIPIMVGNAGLITIGKITYGVTRRRY
jgi:hypothetical protein